MFTGGNSAGKQAIIETESQSTVPSEAALSIASARISATNERGHGSPDLTSCHNGPILRTSIYRYFR